VNVDWSDRTQSGNYLVTVGSNLPVYNFDFTASDDGKYYEIDLQGAKMTFPTSTDFIDAINNEFYISTVHWYWVTSGGTTAIQQAYENGLADADVSGYYDLGYQDALDDVSWIDANSDGFDDASYNAGDTAGYNRGIIGTLDFGVFTAVLDLMSGIFTTTIFPGVTIGTLASIPIVFGIFRWFLKVAGGK
jgi:hypothetical protein